MPRPKGASSTTKTQKTQKTQGDVEKPKKTQLLDSPATREIIKEFGDSIFSSARQITDHPPEVISVSPALDVALGGGFQVGTFVILAGQPRTGKTTTALHFASKWQETGRRVIVIPAEGRLEVRNLYGTSGLNIDTLLVARSSEQKVLNAQEQLSIALKYIQMDKDCLIIVDSISIMSEQREMETGIGTETRGGSGKLFSQFCRLATPYMPVKGHIFLGMAQLYSNTSGQGKKYLASMGKKMDYALSTLMMATHSESYPGTSEDGVAPGQINHWIVQRSPLGPPNAKATSYQRYGYGIDEPMEYIKFAEDLMLVGKGGAWYQYPKDTDEPLVKAQGMEKFREKMLATPEAYGELQRQVRELLG